MNLPNWLDPTELDESIEALDAIKPDPLEARINDAVFWVESALDRKAVNFDLAALRSQAMHDAFAKICAIIVKREMLAGRQYVEPKK